MKVIESLTHRFVQTWNH